MSDLSSIERLKIEALFGMESGYVLNFSDNTFSMFTVENVGIDPLGLGSPFTLRIDE